MGTQRRATAPPGGALPGVRPKALISKGVSLWRDATAAGVVASRGRCRPVCFDGCSTTKARRTRRTRDGPGARRPPLPTVLPYPGESMLPAWECTLAQPFLRTLRCADRMVFLDTEPFSAAAQCDGRRGRCIGHSAPCRNSGSRDEECVHMGRRGQGSSARVA